MSLGPVDFPTLGWEIIDWIETYLVHGPGDVQGDQIELDEEFARFVCHAYRLREEDGRRYYRRAFLSRPKGRAKSELAGMLVCAELLGPVRFDGNNAKGDPIGRPVRSPFIRCLATEEGQAGNTYDNVREMLSHLRDNFSDTYPGVDVGLTRTFTAQGGSVVPSTASNSSKDGGRETFAVFDETHLYVLPELKRMHATVRRNLAKRKTAEPWAFETSTMYAPGLLSVAEGTHEHARAIADGRIPDDGLLFDHRQIPVDIDWDNDLALREGLEHVYGPFSKVMDLERIIAEIRDPQTDEADARRYFGNQVVRRTEQAFDVEAWQELSTDEPPPSEGLVVAGFDGARFHDATALVACHVETGYLWTLGVWEKPTDAGEFWEVPEDEVNQAVEELFDTFDVWRFYADPPYWESAVDRWAGTYGAERVVRWWTNRVKPMAYAVRAFTTAIQSGEIGHDGNTDLARHVANSRRYATRVRDESGLLLYTLRKEHPDSPNKIDATMAAILAWEARGDAISAGALKSRRRRKTRAAGF